MSILYLFLFKLHHVHCIMGCSLFTDEPNSFYLFFKISICFLIKIKVYNVAIHLRVGWCVAQPLEIPMKKTKWKNTYLTYTSHLGSDFQKLTKNGQWLCDLSPFSSVSLSYLVLDLYMKVQYQLDCLSVNTHMHTHTHTHTHAHRSTHSV